MHRLRFALLVGLLLTLGLPGSTAQALTPTPTPTPEDGPTYTVQPGDTLVAIAERFNVDLQALMQANGISDPRALRAGMRLVLPGLPQVQGELTTVTIGLCEDGFSLARRYRIPWPVLRRLNRLTSPAQLYPGRALVLPQTETGPQPMARYLLGQEETLEEAAVRTGRNPWVWLLTSQKRAGWQALPGEVLLAPDPQRGTPDLGACPPQVREIRLRPTPPVQGQPWSMWWMLTDRVQTLQGRWRDRAMPFHPWDGPTPTPAPASQAGQVLVGLQGVHPMLRSPQVYPLELEMTVEKGRVWRFTQPLRVQPGDYGYEELQVPPMFLDPATERTEGARVAEIMSQVTPQRMWEGAFASPIPNGENCFSSYFGTRRNYNNGARWGYHAGLDFCGGKGTPIYAPAPGRVVLAQPLTIRGNAVILDHGWGVYTGYWHMSRIAVQEGQQVQTGDLLGYVGGTGRVTGPHLHWEVWTGGVPTDPLLWLREAWP